MDPNKRPDDMARITTPELAQAFIAEQVDAIREQVGDKKVLLALSGGVDSSVVAALLIKAIGKQLICVHVNHGLHGLFGVGGGRDVVAVFEGARHEVACVLFVVDDENGRFHVSLLTRFSRRGMRTVNLVPAPSLDSTSISPPCARTMRRESMRPSPVPARFVVR